LEAEREALGHPAWRIEMKEAVQEITLSPSGDLAFNKVALERCAVEHIGQREVAR